MIFNKAEISLLLIAFSNSRIDLEFELADSQIKYNWHKEKSVQGVLKQVQKTISYIQEHLLLTPNEEIDVPLTLEEFGSLSTLCLTKLSTEKYTWKDKEKATNFMVACANLINKIGIGYMEEMGAIMQQGIT